MRAFVSCVSQKHGKIKANISHINENSLEETFNVWRHQSKGTTPATDVYKGTQWNLIKNLNTKIPTNVISSGYGIIDLQTPIVPYSITFSSAYVENKHLLVPKYDLTQKEANRKWFNMFGDYSNLWDTDEVLIFTVNPLYLSVLDLPKKDNIIVLSDYRLGRLAKWLGTGANNLSVTFANYLVDNYPNISGNKELKNFVDYLDKRYGADLYEKRQKCDDKFILDWINKGNSLKKLRDAGYSCSKQRFINLKKQNNVEETIN